MEGEGAVVRDQVMSGTQVHRMDVVLSVLSWVCVGCVAEQTGAVGVYWRVQEGEFDTV